MSSPLPRRVLITGAGRGIGLGLVRVYLERGDRVFASCRRPEGAEALVDLRTRHGDRLTILRMDVSDEDSILGAAREFGDRGETLDVLINNAGVLFASESLAEVGRDGLMESFAINSVAPLLVSRAFRPFLTAADAPRIVNLTMPTRPVSRLEATGNHAYVASRYALNALSRMMALELRGQGIIVVTMWPGYLRTDMNRMAADAREPSEALPQVVRVVDGLTLGDSGSCLMPDGTRFEP